MVRQEKNYTDHCGKSMTVGEKIQAIRKEKGLTQEELGKRCGMEDSAIRRYELGKANPKIETLQKVSIALGIPIERLIPFNINCFPSESQMQKCHNIADHYGFKNQSMMMIEECSELQKAICKWHRKYDGSFKSESSDCQERTDIIDELADVIIMAKQLSYLLSAEDEVSEQIEFKLDRQLRRMEEESCKE